ncbi:MAG: GNAT family N-acetyltransferase [Actinomycetaceae bacterium]|nr:GNAT family N-acetyltransferase [Actinomycetaceae bacterium]
METSVRIIDQPNKEQIRGALALLVTQSYWAKERTEEEMERIAAGSLNWVAVDHEGVVIGYARVVTDRERFAYIADVIVDETMRGQQVGAQIMGEIMDLLQGWRIQKVLLCTDTAHGFYEHYGFEVLPNPHRYMLANFRD